MNGRALRLSRMITSIWCFLGMLMEVTSPGLTMWNTHLSRGFYMSKENTTSEYPR